MSKSTSLFLIDMALFVALMVTSLTGVTSILTQSNLHIFLGLSLSVVALWHLGLHWKWIKIAWQRYDRLPESTQSNVRLDMGLFCTYILCGGIGLIGRVMQLPFHRHVFLGVIHVCLAILILGLQAIHISRHWNWITTMTRNIEVSNIRKETQMNER